MDVGADDFIIEGENSACHDLLGKSKCDILLDTIPVEHQISDHLAKVKKGGHYILLGRGNQKRQDVDMALLVRENKSLGCSYLGGIQDTQECLNFCLNHKIYGEFETITADQLDEKMREVEVSETKGKRFVLDVKSSL